jgi:hypothetical protein
VPASCARRSFRRGTARDLFQRRAAVLAAEPDLPIAAEQQVVLDGHRAEQRARLGHQRHALHHALLERQQADRPAVVVDLAARGQHAHQRVQQGRLAGAVRPMTVITWPGGGQVQAVQDLGAAVAGMEIPHFEQVLSHGW